MSVYIGAARIQDKHGATLRAFQVTTLERDELGREQLGWALIAGRDMPDACRRAKRRWPSVTVLGCTGAPQ